MTSSAATHVLTSSKWEGLPISKVPLSDLCHLSGRGRVQLTALDALYLRGYFEERKAQKAAEYQRRRFARSNQRLRTAA